ncbi:hypothetical protein, conserved [Leishmania tarentolae]|uniref:PH-like domain-containing protein n=1 Tax=Leishmania tarentolae TaxID=5689 RepID=A0A640KRT8_LEITA|nr:hypothetical protein, conserved [Leishmania tarentolae]
MSSRRGRQWQSLNGASNNDIRLDSSAGYSSGTHTKPLHYDNGDGFRSSDFRRTLDESVRYYDAQALRWGSQSASTGARAARVEAVRVGSKSQEEQRQHASQGRGVMEPGAGGGSESRGDRRYVAPFSCSTSSYTYSYSNSDRNNGDSLSEEGAWVRKKIDAGLRLPTVQDTSPSRLTPDQSAISSLNVTPAAPPPDAPPPGAIRWVGNDRSDRRVQRSGEGASKVGSLPCRLTDVKEQNAVVKKPMMSPRPLLSDRIPSLRSSGLLRRVIAAVAYYRGVPPPPSVPPEVILAFDEYVSHGALMLKFTSCGPPHRRFFVIRFLDVAAGSLQVSGGRAYDQGPGVLHAVFSWYRNATSRHMIRFLPLHDLIEVKADGTDHPYVRRRTAQPGILRGPRSGFVTKYVRAKFIAQFRFRSRLSRAEETLAVMAENRTQYLAWLVVGSFISQIGHI